MITIFILLILGILALITSLISSIRLVIMIYSWFLPSITELLLACITLFVSLGSLTLGVFCIGTMYKKYRKWRSLRVHQVAVKTAEANSDEYHILSASSTTITEATKKVVTYCFSKDTFLKSELQEISTTLSSLSGLFKNVAVVMERRFTGGLTSTKYQQGIEALRVAVLIRIDNQIMQLCAVDEDDLKQKAVADSECEKSLNKLTQYIHGTQTLLNKTVGLVSRMALEAMDCDIDVLERESAHVLELVQELKEYK